MIEVSNIRKEFKTPVVKEGASPVCEPCLRENTGRRKP